MQAEPTAAVAPHPREWNMPLVEARARHRGGTPEARLIATFDVFNEVFRRADRGSRSFTELLASAPAVAGFDSVITRLAEEAHLDDVASLVTSWRILTHGSARSFVDGDRQSGLNAKHMAEDLVARHRRPLSAFAIDVSLDEANQQRSDSIEWS